MRRRKGRSVQEKDEKALTRKNESGCRFEEGKATFVQLGSKHIA